MSINVVEELRKNLKNQLKLQEEIYKSPERQYYLERQSPELKKNK